LKTVSAGIIATIGALEFNYFAAGLCALVTTGYIGTKWYLLIKGKPNGSDAPFAK